MTVMPLVPLESTLPRVLVMDECVEILDLLRDALSEDGLCLILRSELLSLDEIRSLGPAMIILERRFQGSVAGSWMLMREIRRDPVLSDTPVILCTTDPTPRLSLSLQWELQSLGVHVLVKPFHLEDLRGLVRGARVRELVAGHPGLVQALPMSATWRASSHTEENHHEPALRDHGTPLSGWTPRRP